MKYYFLIKGTEIISKGNCPCSAEGHICVEVDKIHYDLAQEKGLNYFIYDNGEIVLNPDYEEKQKQKERERIGKLTCTKRVFALMLQELGISYSQLKSLIDSNEQAQLEWDLCVELLRSNPMLDLMASQLGITSEQLDNLFLYANGEISLEEFKGAK